MQFQVDASLGSTTTAFNLPRLQTGLTAAYGASQDKPIVPQPAYNQAFGTTTTAQTIVHIQDTTMSVKPTNAATVTVPLQPKAIQELFDPEWGRMNALLGVEVPNTTMINQTTIPFYFIDPPTETFTNSDPAAIAAAPSTPGMSAATTARQRDAYAPSE